MTTAPESFQWTIEWANQHPSPVAKMLGFKVTAISPGRVTTEMDYHPGYLELVGIYNSGVLVSLADYAFVLAARTVTDPQLTFEPDLYPLVVQLSVNLVHGTGHGRVTAEAKVIHHGRTTQVVETELRDEKGRLLGKVNSAHVTVPRYASAEGPVIE